MSETRTYSLTSEEVPCPWCGAENRLTDLYNDLQGPEEAETECRECEKPFVVSFTMCISASAERMEQP